MLQGAKQNLRKSMALKLQKVADTDIRHQSKLIMKHLQSSPQYTRSKTVSCFLNMSGEVDTSDIVQEVLSSGRTLYVPRIRKGSARTMDFLQIHDVGDLDSLSPGVWGIKEPDLEYAGGVRRNATDEGSEILDLILLPGVAFDRSFGRLGHGRGYYDQFINIYFKRCAEKGVASPVLLALSLREQVLPAKEIPMGKFDRYMDGIVTPDGMIENDNGKPSNAAVDAITLPVSDTITESAP